MTQALTTTETVEALLADAARAGDLGQVDICRAALHGDSAALAECQRVIDDALAQDDGEGADLSPHRNGQPGAE